MYPKTEELKNRKQIIVSMLNSLNKQSKELNKQLELLNAELISINNIINLHKLHEVEENNKE